MTWSESIARPQFSHHASLFRIDKNPIAPILFVQSVTLSVLSVLIGWSMLYFLATGEASTSWFAVHALCADLPLPTTECLQATTLVGLSSSWDGPVYSAATSPATVWSQFKLDLKERDNKQNKVRARAKTGREGCNEVASQWVSWYS